MKGFQVCLDGKNGTLFSAESSEHAIKIEMTNTGVKNVTQAVAQWITPSGLVAERQYNECRIVKGQLKYKSYDGIRLV